MSVKGKRRYGRWLITFLALSLLLAYGVLNFLKLWPLSLDNLSRELKIEIHANVDGEDLVISKRLVCYNRFKWDAAAGRRRGFSFDSTVFNYVDPDGWGMRFELGLGKHCTADLGDKIWFGELAFPRIYLLDKAVDPTSAELYESYTNVDRHDFLGGRLNPENLYMTIESSRVFGPEPRTDRVPMGSVGSEYDRSGRRIRVPPECKGVLWGWALWSVDPEAVLSFGLEEMDFLPEDGTDMRLITAWKPGMTGPYSSKDNPISYPIPPYSSEFQPMTYDMEKMAWVVDDDLKNVFVLNRFDPTACYVASNDCKPGQGDFERGSERPLDIQAFEIAGNRISYKGKGPNMGSAPWVYNSVTKEAWVLEYRRIQANFCWQDVK